MNVNGRLSKLEGHPAFAAPKFHGVEEGFTVQGEHDRWGRLLKPLDDADWLDDETAAALGAYLLERFWDLVGWVQSQGDSCPHLVRALRRLPRLLALLLPKVPPDLRPDLVVALSVSGPLGGDWRPYRLRSWVWDIAFGDGRLPPDATEETVGTVIREVLANPESGITMVCDRCGLARPCAPRCSSVACPHCGEAAWTWSNQLGEGRSWQAPSAAELDPDTSLGRRPRYRARG